MEEEITPARIANAICQDTTYEGYYVLVEGKKDVRIYRRFTSDVSAKVKATFGKSKLREVYRILTERNFVRKIGIRDADFLRIKGNPKYTAEFTDPIFVTDGHDSEIMMVATGVINNFFLMVTDEAKVAVFEEKHNKKVVDMIFSLIRPLGNLRLANKRFGLGLAFKPERPEGNALRIDRFVNSKSWGYNGDESMVNTVIEYSKNRGSVVASRAVVLEKLREISMEEHPNNEICNGHDFAYVLHLISKQGIGSKSKLLQDSACVEDLLISQFDWIKFSGTQLFARINQWQNIEEKVIFEAR
ncbi:DUF4435 domain-containing protein [Herbaspirillum sp. C7C2]|uniref:DUF4435 domain-containing protein n=1 Tax=Herbaspirillum sp. C7C2 TaxID=2736666 RepID=UPI001F515B44|nr:DUF4435 domain-containing protein [Herbaspirillum sp. C7C2]MCI1012297.1 DUF4435 domain-containing protein [Herbaspirillum sp. C7C2]